MTDATGHFHLFAYGTLREAKPGTPGGSLLAGCDRVGTGTVEGTLFDLGDYPALLLSGDEPVEGTIWRCPSALLPELDRYEGVGEGLFRRVARRVDGHACWIYVAGPRLGLRLTPGARVRSEGAEDRRPGRGESGRRSRLDD